MSEAEIDLLDDLVIDLPDLTVVEGTVAETASALRFPVDLRVIWDNGEKCASGPALNMSASGMFIKTTEPPPVGKDVRLMPMINGRNTDLVIRGRVVRVGSVPHTGMGVQFTPHTRGEKRALEKFVELYSARAEPLR